MKAHILQYFFKDVFPFVCISVAQVDWMLPKSGIMRQAKSPLCAFSPPHVQFYKPLSFPSNFFPKLQRPRLSTPLIIYYSLLHFPVLNIFFEI